MTVKSTDKSRIRRAIFRTEKDGTWNYYGKGPLVIRKNNLSMHLEFFREMSDPVAMFRPQRLSSFHGTALAKGGKTRLYRVIVIVGTDEGLRSGWAPILIGSRRSISQYVKREMFQLIHKIIPPEYLEMIPQLDGYDLGILIRLGRWEDIYKNRNGGLPLDRVYSELISEVGWLKGGEEELQERLAKLEQLGLIGHKGEGDSTVFFITDKAREKFEGLR